MLLWLSQTRTDSLAALASPRRKKGPPGPAPGGSAGARKRLLTEDSSPEVSSSSVGPAKVRAAQGSSGVSPVPSLSSSDIAEVDLDFWDLDINNESNSTCSGNARERTRLLVPGFAAGHLSLRVYITECTHLSGNVDVPKQRRSFAAAED